jgi:hypothetical protein
MNETLLLKMKRSANRIASVLGIERSRVDVNVSSEKMPANVVSSRKESPTTDLNYSSVSAI